MTANVEIENGMVCSDFGPRNGYRPLCITDDHTPPPYLLHAAWFLITTALKRMVSR